jgi:hypothetical protein
VINTLGLAKTARARIVPELRHQNGDSLRVGGLGLVLVDSLTERWGTDLRAWGKHVWVELKVKEQA